MTAAKLPPAAAAITRIVSASPVGLSSAEVRAQVGTSADTVCKHLRTAAAAGAVVCTDRTGGGCARWCVPQHLDAARAFVAEQRREKEEARMAQRRAYHAAHRRNRQEEADRVEIPTRQVRVRAVDAPRLNVRAPVSVFHLGEFL